MHGADHITPPVALLGRTKDLLVALEMTSPMNPVVYALVAGLVSHQYFKRNEPTLSTAAILFILGESALLCLLAYTGTPTLLRDCLVLSTIYFSSLATSILVYRAWFHPLNHIPGPFLARLSKWWAVGLTIEGKNHTRTLELHRMYGDFVRLGPNDVSICNANAIPTVYGPGSEWKRSDWYKGVPRPPHSESLMSFRAHAEHSQRRKVWERAFTPSALKGYQPLMAKRVQQLIERLLAVARLGPVDIGDWLGACSFDFMGDLAFDGGFNLIEQGDVDGYARMIHESVRVAAIFINLTWLTEPLAAFAAAFPFLPLAATKAKLEGFAAQQVKSRMQKGSIHKDLSYWLFGEDTGVQEIETNDLVADAVLVIVAGSDSTTLASFFLLYRLAIDKAVRSRLVQEIEAVYEEHGELPVDVLAGLPFLNACINEALRMYPPIPNGHPRKAPRGGGMVAGQMIPEGTTVIVPEFSLHRDPKYWGSDAAVFRPERWLEPAKQALADGAKTAFVPFAYGPYNCVGKALALQNLRLIVATIVHYFEFEPAEGFDPVLFEERITGEFLLTRPELPLVLTARAAKN